MPPIRHLSILLVLCVAPSAAADEPPSYSCQRVYVDPDPAAGNDANSGTIGSPKLTVNAGIQAIQSGSGTGTVVLLPGRYSAGTNGEAYPVSMVPGISLQGTNALNTILDGSGQSPEALLLFQQQTSNQVFGNTFVNGLTLTNNDAGAAVRIRGNFAPLLPTISNCFLVQNCVGISIQEVQPFVVPPPWVGHEPTIFHCTIADNEIGIHDVGITVDPSTMTPFYFGIGRAVIVNCIVFGNATSDLLGVDDSDLLRTAFGTSQAGSTTCGFQLYPTPSIAGSPPPESIISIPGGGSPNLFIDPSSWDYRSFPTSPLVDAGDPGPTWSVANGASAIVAFPCHPDATAVDAEGHGNPRFEGAAPDLGADERGQLIVAGYDAMSTTFSGASPARVIYMNPEPAISGAVRKATHYLGVTAVGYTNLPQPFGTPGVNPIGTSACVPRVGPLCTGFDCIDSSTYVSGYPQVQVMDFLGIPTITTLTPGATAEQFCLQIIPRNGNGSQETCLSNLQCYVLEP